MKTIGLVLPAAPGYSETFFASKIRGLASAGYRVVLFAKGDMNPDLPARQVKPYPVTKSRTAMIFLLPLVLLITFLRAPSATARFWKLEKHSGKAAREIAERLYLSAHILPHRLAWLHFGFITQAVRKETTAAAIGAKMGVSLRGYDISIYPLMHPGILQSVWPRITKLHVLSDDLLAAARRFGKPESLPSVKITPAIDVSSFAAEGKSLSAGERIQILTVARLHWKKGLEYALEACAVLRKQQIEFTYTIVGDGSELEKLVFLADQLGISDRVIFRGKLKQPQIIELQKQSHLYLQPSIQEGFCNSVLEAQAAGLLCVVSDAEGLPENVEHGRTGYVVPRRDILALAEAMTSMIHLPDEQKAAFRNQAKHRTREKFSIENQNKAWMEFFKD